MKTPKHIYADYDPNYKGGERWQFYATKAEQRENRPDLKPFKVRLGKVRPTGGAK